MKKYSFVFCLILMFAIGFGFVNFGQKDLVCAEEDSYVPISTVQDVVNIVTNPNGKFRLTSDIDFSDVTTFAGISTFSGVIDGNGYTISNINIESTDTSSVGIFNELTYATIKNLQFRNITISLTQTMEQDYLKAGLICANMVSSTLENCSVVVDMGNTNSITVDSKSRTYVGGMVGNMIDGSIIKNCYVNANLQVSNTSNSKTNYVGGVVGYLDNSTLNFVVEDCVISASNVMSQQSYIGGILGEIVGNRSNIYSIVSKTSITIEDCTENLLAYSLFGKVSLTSTPQISKLNYIYSSNSLDKVGNIDELNAKTGTEKLFDNKLENNVEASNFSSKQFYTDNQKFDTLNPWNFSSIWQLKDQKSLPALQHFDSFTFTVDEAKSFAYIKKPNISNVITFITNANNTYRYGESLQIGGYINNISNMNKFFKVVGIRKDGNIIFDNNKIEQIIDPENIDTTTEIVNDVTIYKNNGQIVTEQNTSVGGNSAKTYTINTSSISWSKYTTGDNEVSLYTIPNGNLTDTGTYTLALETINYKITVKSENVDQGTVKRSTATMGQKEFVDANVAYGSSLSYMATPTSDFGFSGWYRDENKNTFLYSQQQIIFTFNESAFTQGGTFDGLTLGEDELLLVATFTKRVCDIQIMFAVNDKITDQILSSVKFNDANIQAKDGVLTVKAKMGQTAKFVVTIPADYEFASWFQSDGTSNIGNVGDTLEITIDITDADESMILVANFKQDIEEKNDSNTWIWIVSGIGGGLLIIGLVVFFIIKGKRGGLGGGGKNDYKKMYY